jgi:ankyrin repeat protein
MDQRDIDAGLFRAASDGKAHAVTEFLALGGNVNYQNPNGRTALHQASLIDQLGDHMDIINALLDRRADVNCQDICESTPLHFAVHRGNLDAVKTLLDRGADANCQNKLYCTPLHTAAAMGVPKVALELFKYGANANLRDTFGHTPLHTAALFGNIDVVRTVLTQKAETNCLDNIGRSAFHVAFFSGHPTIARLLLLEGSENTIPHTSETIKQLADLADFCLATLLEQLEDELHAIRNNSENTTVRAKMNHYTKEYSNWKTLLLAPYHLLPDYLVEFAQNTVETMETVSLCIRINDVLKEIAHAIHLSEYGRRMAEEIANLDASGYNKTNSH